MTEVAGLGYGLLASTEYCAVSACAMPAGGLLGSAGSVSLGLLACGFFGLCLVLRLTWPRVRLSDLLPLCFLGLMPCTACTFTSGFAVSLLVMPWCHVPSLLLSLYTDRYTLH